MGGVMVERSDKMWSTGESNGKPLHYSCFENPKNSMKRQKDRMSHFQGNFSVPREPGAVVILETYGYSGH